MLGMIKYLPLALDPKNLQRALDDIRLSYALLIDPRVPLGAKAIPGLATVYLISPLDLVPGWVPVLGQLDDLVVLMLAVQAFKQMVPPALLAEHQARLGIAPALPA